MLKKETIIKKIEIFQIICIIIFPIFLMFKLEIFRLLYKKNKFLRKEEYIVALLIFSYLTLIALLDTVMRIRRLNELGLYFIGTTIALNNTKDEKNENK